MQLDQIKNEIQILKNLLPKSEGELWTQRNERLTELRKKLDKIQDQPKHHFISSLYREKIDHQLEQHPMERALFGIAGVY